jgi:hypothetical protein
MPEPDGPQFQNLWAAAMDEAQANLDALSDEELEGGAFLADPSGGGEWIDDPEPVSRCGYCGEASDYCQGHGEDERAEYGFEPDSDEYDIRREFFEENVPGTRLRHGNRIGHTQAEQPVTHGGILPTENQISAAADRDRAREAGHTPDMMDMQGRAFRPNYDEPDPFDRSDPEQARQAKAIEDMNETLGE